MISEVKNPKTQLNVNYFNQIRMSKNVNVYIINVKILTFAKNIEYAKGEKRKN